MSKGRKMLFNVLGVLLVAGVVWICVSSAMSDTPRRPAIPKRELDLCRVLAQFADEYTQDSNELRRAPLKARRAAAILEALGPGDFDVKNWVGTLGETSIVGDGNGGVAVKMACRFRAKTWNNAFSDRADHTAIPAGSDLFRSIQTLSPGAGVYFSGSFIQDEKDGVKELSITDSGSMSDPELLFRFTDVSTGGVRTP